MLEPIFGDGKVITGGLMVAALYCVWCYVSAWIEAFKVRRKYGPIQGMPTSIADWLRDMELHTFHLGLCLILSLGFLGLILKHG